MTQEFTAQVGAAATVPQLWVHSPGQCRHVHDTKRCQSCAATAACHAGLWSLCQTAGYASLTYALVPLFNHAFVLLLTHLSIHLFVHACTHVGACIRFLVVSPGTSFRTHLVHTVLCTSLHEVAVGQLAYQQQHALTLYQVRPQNDNCQL